MGPEVMLEDRVLQWGPPLANRSLSPEAFEFQWISLDYVFGLPSPYSFPPLPDKPEDGDIELFRRYVVAAGELAESAILCGDDQMTLQIDRETGEGQIESKFSSKEITRGFSVLLRQFDSSNSSHDQASFQVVSSRLRYASTATSDGKADERCRQIDAWGKACRELHKFSLPKLVRSKVTNPQGVPVLDYDDDHPPSYYLDAYNYGELIHWSGKREVVAEWEKDPFHQSWQRINFLEAAVGLAHIYIGFSELVRTAIGE